MGFGAGTLISAASYELVAKSLSTSERSGGAVLGFFSGSLVFFLADRAIARSGARRATGSLVRSGPALGIALGAFLDGVPESAVLGLSLIEDGRISVAMLVAVFLSNLPESMAASTELRASGWPQSRLYGLWTAITLASALSAALGYATLSDASPGAVAFVLAFAAGAIITMLSTAMIPEAFENAGRAAGLATTVGFALSVAVGLLADRP
jgi:ZIP family zinc transporter